jgi:O-antigen ligase
MGRQRLSTKIAMFALAVGLLMVVVSFVPESILQRLGTTEADIASGYFGRRGMIWAAGLDVARAHPIAGVGAGAFGAAVVPALHFEWSSHNTPLSFLVEYGLIGVCLFGLMIAAGVAALRPLPRLERRFGLILLLTLGVGSLTLEWDNRKQFWFVLGIVPALAALRPRPQRIGELESSEESAPASPILGGGESPLDRP